VEVEFAEGVDMEANKRLNYINFILKSRSNLIINIKSHSSEDNKNNIIKDNVQSLGK
jgi:hypothetical protein